MCFAPGSTSKMVDVFARATPDSITAGIVIDASLVFVGSICERHAEGATRRIVAQILFEGSDPV